MITRNNLITAFLSILLLIPLLSLSSIDFQQTDGPFNLPLLSSNPESDTSRELGIYSEQRPSRVDPSISELVDELPVYYPESTIKFRNRFTIPNSGGNAIVDHNVSIFLNKQGYSNPLDPAHFIMNTTTNGSYSGNTPISTAPLHGWIDTSFVLPSLSDLDTIYGIVPGDNATIYQWLDPRNTRFLDGVQPIFFADNFSVSGFSQISELGGFVNPASGDNTFREGENASVILKATSALDNVPNVEVNVTLHYNSTNLPITNGTIGFNYYLRDVASGNPSTITNGNGELKLIVDTLTTTPKAAYFFNITGNFSGTPYFTQNYNPSDPGGSNYHLSTANFTVENEMDTVSLNVVDISEDPLEPPNVNVTIITYRVSVESAYGGTYYLPNLPVNATLDSYPNGVVLESVLPDFPNNGTTGWFLTNSSGHIAFKITATFPTLFNDTISTITTTVNLADASYPSLPYPSGPPPQPHRFLQSQILTTNETNIDSLSINPDFWLGEIGLFSIDTTSIRPGESAILVFEVNSTQAPAVPFVGVPVEFVVNPSIAGVSLSVAGNNPYGNFYETDVNGRIQVTVDSTYLTTPEIFSAINLDITIDFENDSQIRWIGDQHAGTDILANFDITWLEDSFSGLTIDPSFTTYEIAFFGTNETGDDTTIRSGDGLDITFKVQSQGTGLAGVPVTVNLGAPYPGVSLSPVGGTSTDFSGLVTVRLSTTYPTTPKSLPIVLNATADFENDTSPNIWLVGEKSFKSNFFSNSSYSDVEQIITVAPQYFLGEIDVAPIANNPNATRIGQTEWINITFRLYMTYSGGGSVYPTIDNVNISIQVNNQNPSLSNMTVIPGTTFQDSSGSYATFYLKATTNTLEAFYNLNATAHFGDAQGLTYNVPHATVPSGVLAGVWVNGSHTDDISFAEYQFEVKNTDRIQVQIASLADASHPDEGLNATTTYTEIYRGTTNINVSGTYVDPLAGPLPESTPVSISFNYTNLAMVTINQLLANVLTDSNGAFWSIVTIPTNVPLQDIEIYGWDPNTPDPQETRDFITKIRLMSSISFSNHALSGYNGNAIFTGESVTASATIRDDQGVIVNSAPFNGLIRVTGWNSTQEVGTATSGSLTSGSYSLSYNIPNNYGLNTIFIRSKVIWGAGLVHYRPSNDQIEVNVYNDFNINTLEFDLPDNSTPNLPIVNGSVYYIKGFTHQQITIHGILVDQVPRPLRNKDVISYWNASSQTQSTSVTTGSFNFTYDFTGFINVTWIWTFYHTLDNGTTLTKLYAATFIWEVVDDTKPSITINSPVGINVTALTPTSSTTISTTILDPSPPSAISAGLDTSSVRIRINNGAPNPMVNMGLGVFTFNWDTSLVGDEEFHISIYAFDLAGNLQNISVFAVFDVVQPFATITATNTPIGNDYFAIIDSNGDIQISGTLSDSSSITDKMSGIDSTSILLDIGPQGDTAILTLNDNSIAVDQTSFSYNWHIFNNVTNERLPLFLGGDFWEIVVTISDNAGNNNKTTIILRLEETDPIVQITAQPPSLIEQGGFGFSVNVSDTITGLNMQSVEFTVNSVGDSSLIATFTNDSSEVSINGVDIELTLDISMFENGEYTITATIFDNIGNSGSIESGDFGIRHITTTIPTTTLPPTTPTPPPLNPIDLVQFLLLDIIALGGGIGIALLFEKVKTRRNE
ncbi:MAG: hypothetical protein ACXAC6_08770 [Candidatus Hodarchaeales archaeon]